MMDFYYRCVRQLDFFAQVEVDDDDDDDDDDGFPANSHHDKIPPWWEYVINRGGGFLSPAYSHH